MAGTPAPPVVIPASVPFLPKWLLAFADNEYQRIIEKTFRDFATDINGSFVKLDELNTNMVRGGLSLLPYTTTLNGQPSVPTNLLGRRFTILGMDVRCVNGTGQTETAAGVKADPIDFRLLRSTTGTVDALVDILPTTTATVKAHWVRTSGTDEQKVASYQELPIEDQNVYRGEVYQYTFENLTPAVTRLVEIKQDMTMFSHPLPTGEDDDPYYKNFAPLSSATYNDSELRELISVLQTSKVSVASTVTVGGVATTYNTPQEAINYGPAGVPIVLRGVLGNLNVYSSDTIDAAGASFGTNTFTVGYPITNAPQTVNVRGFSAAGRVVLCPQATPTANVYTLSDVIIEQGGRLELFLLSSGAYQGVPDVVNLVNVRAHKTAVFDGGGAATQPLILIQGRSDYNQRRLKVNILNCYLRNDVGPIIGGNVTRGSKFYQQGTTQYVPMPGHAVQEATSLDGGSPVALTDAEMLVDETTNPGGATLAQLAVVATTLPATATRTANYTLQLSDAGYQVPISSATAITVTLPHFADMAFAAGAIIEISQDGAGQVTVVAGANAVIQSLDGAVKTPGQFGVIGLRKVDSATWRVTGAVQ